MAGGVERAADPLVAAAADAQAIADLAELLRRLRRRDARRRQDSELTYRELAAKTGWSQAAVGEYFRGRTLPPTDRFDVLTALLGATPVERGALATARDRVEERQRRTNRSPGGSGRTGPAGAEAGRTVPRQLPADVAGFAGRGAQLADLDARLAPAGPAGARAAAPVYAISGTAGVGKTALAVHWAHRVADRFPDGQLYVNLRGFDPGGSPLPPAAAVRGFLDAFGVPADQLPSSVDAQVGLYRSLLAGRRVLVLLDNARDAEQARPLLPGTPTALALVTSRDQLAGLVAADGAHPITLDLLAGPEAHELMAHRLGADRVAAEPAAVAEIVTRCARLPLALTVAAARAATAPAFPLAALAAELAQAGDRLAALTAGDPATDVRAVFSWSYTALTPAAARLFRLLGLHPGPDVSTAAVASLAGQPPAAVRPVLAELTRTTLLGQPAPGRYTCHDLLREYAAGLGGGAEAEAERQAAVRRLLDHHLHSAHAADQVLGQHRDPTALDPPAPGVTPERPADHQAALDWFGAELTGLLAATGLAARAGLPAHIWQLGRVIQTFCSRAGRWADLVAAGLASVAATASLDDPVEQAATHRQLAAAYTELGQHAEAHRHFRHALDRSAGAGDPVGRAHAHYGLGYLCERQQRLRPALEHAQQALALYRAADHARGQADALNACGWNHAQLGEFRQALDCCRQALALQQQLDDPEGEANSWDSLGYAHHRLGDHRQAADCYRQALALFRDLGDRNNEADCLTHLGDTQQAAGDPVGARASWQQALRIRTDLDHPGAEEIRARLDRLD